MKEPKTKEQIILDSKEEIEMACMNIFENLQANEVTLIDKDILELADNFFLVLQKQNSKVIVTGDGKYNGRTGDR